MSETIDARRRRLVQTAGLSIAAVQFGLATAASAQGGDSAQVLSPSPPSHTAFADLKQVDAGVLNVGYAEAGPAGGPVVLLLHGWPYDIYSYVDVAPLLAAAGYRVIVPYLRGYGTTRFLSAETVRNGQQSAIAQDMIDLMDALKIRTAIVAGFDWGARTADIMAALWPERCKAIVAVSGYIITNLKAQQQPLPPKAELGWWYQYYFATERGRIGYDRNRHDFAKLIWKLASPKWNFDDATFERSAAAFDNPDHVAIVVHNYRWRLGLADGERKYDALEARLQQAPLITVPAITIGSDFDGPAADGKGYAKQYSGKYAHRIFNGIGHDVPQEAPQAFAQAVIDVANFRAPSRRPAPGIGAQSPPAGAAPPREPPRSPR